MLSCRSAPTTTFRCGRPAKPSRFTSQPARRSTPVPGRGQTGEVGHHRPGHVAHAGLGRQTRAGPATSRSPPARPRPRPERTPSRPAFWSQVEVNQSAAERGRQRPTDHPAEEPSRRHRHHPGLGPGDQLLDHGQGVGPLLGKRAPQRGGHPLDVGAGRHRTLAQSLEIARGLVQDPLQHLLFFVVHHLPPVRPHSERDGDGAIPKSPMPESQPARRKAASRNTGSPSELEPHGLRPLNVVVPTRFSP